MTSPILVAGLPLPHALGRALDEGRWRRPSDDRLLRVFRERPTAPVMLDLDAMHEVNRKWRTETDPAYFGHKDDRVPPGDIDCRRSSIVGRLGPDLPFALDYRASEHDPAVLYLHSGGDRWITVARNIDELLERLGLDHGREPGARARRHRQAATSASRT